MARWTSPDALRVLNELAETRKMRGVALRDDHSALTAEPVLGNRRRQERRSISGPVGMALARSSSRAYHCFKAQLKIRTSEMKRLALALIAAVAVGLLPAIADACPKGYVPCGQKKQLCCPAR